jgi:hypothetical protein
MKPTVRLRPWAQCIPVLLLAFLAACATKRVDWDTRLGHYFYDEVVLELGPPDKEATLSDGTRVAEWLTNRSRSSAHVGVVGGYGYYGRYHPFYGPGHYYGGHTMPDREYWLRLTFGPDDLLISWQRLTR